MADDVVEDMLFKDVRVEDARADAVLDPAERLARACDLSVTCYMCGIEMRPEHAHYRCPACGWRDSCCDGPY